LVLIFDVGVLILLLRYNNFDVLGKSPCGLGDWMVLRTGACR